jgi:hypothetical protein
MEFKLEISRDNSANSYYEVDLFPQQQLEYDLDFYDSLEIDKVKLPFYTKLRIPLTTNNKASNRFDFEPLTSPSNEFPKQDFYFKIYVYGSSTTEIDGILNVVAIEYNASQPYIEIDLKDYLSKYIADIKEDSLGLGDLYTDTYYTQRHTFDRFKNPWNAPTEPGEAGVLNTNPDYSRPISFPYVDFCNDVDGKFGYAARQFMEYGPGFERTGLMPVFSVPKFLEYLGAYISDPTNFPVRVDSKLFKLGNYSASPAFADLEVEKLHMIIPSQLLAKQDVNTRNFFLRQAPAWSGTNESLEACIDYGGNEKMIHTQWFSNMETAGNFGTGPEGQNLYTVEEWGANKRMGFYPFDNSAGFDEDGIRGFFCPKVSFNAGISFNSGNTSASIEVPKLEIPVVQEDKLVNTIDLTSSNMTFKFYIGIYEDGFMKKKLAMQDAQGDDIILNLTGAQAVQGNSNKTSSSSDYDYFQCRVDHEDHGVLLNNNGTFRDTIIFEDFTAYLPPNEEMFIYGGSRYSVNYFIEPFEGTLNVNYATAYAHGGSHHTATAFQTSDIPVEELRKLVTRVDSYGQLNIKFTSNADTFLYKNDDEFIISESINKTCPLTVYDIFTNVLKRFDCGLFYEFDNGTHVLRIDPLSIVRTGSQNINSLVDDLKSVKITSSGDKVKRLSVNNKSYGLFFDDLDNDGVTIGSTTQDISIDGIVDVDINLDSSIYYKSVCGQILDESLISQNLGAFSEKQLGFTPNIFTANKNVGLRFAFLDKPVYKTNMLVPYAVLNASRITGAMKTETQIIYSNSQIGPAGGNIGGQHIFNGRLFHYNTAGWNLMFEDETENTTDTYDNIFADSEKILQSENPRIEFDMVVPTSNLASLDFFLQTLTCTRITPGGILVKSASGDVYDDYAYITIEGILQ